MGSQQPELYFFRLLKCPAPAGHQPLRDTRPQVALAWNPRGNAATEWWCSQAARRDAAAPGDAAAWSSDPAGRGPVAGACATPRAHSTPTSPRRQTLSCPPRILRASRSWRDCTGDSGAHTGSRRSRLRLNSSNPRAAARPESRGFREGRATTVRVPDARAAAPPRAEQGERPRVRAASSRRGRGVSGALTSRWGRRRRRPRWRRRRRRGRLRSLTVGVMAAAGAR